MLLSTTTLLLGNGGRRGAAGMVAHGFSPVAPLPLKLSSSTSRVEPRLFLSGPATGGGRVSNAVTDTNLLDKSGAAAAGGTKKQQKQQKKARLDTNPPKGTRDFYPEDMRLRTWLFSKWRSVAKTYGFSEYDAPVLESESLYTRKAGEEVTGQLYNFEDKGARRVALRPEMTPSLARMVMAKKGGLPLPLKWYSIPQCWRYERMTRGRRREHYQWNMDVWGVPGVQAEAELLDAMVSFFRSVGLTSGDVGIKVSSRHVIGEVLDELGIPEDKFAATCVLIDKLEKVPLDAIRSDLAELGLSVATVERLTTVLTYDTIESLASVLPPNSRAISELTRLFALCEQEQGYDMADWIQFDASIVRGLAYYTGTVFEAFDRRGELRAIAGGGRYDRLLETFGGDPTPAAGFGFGDAVIVELLKERGLLPDFAGAGVDCVVFAMTKELYGPAVRVASRLRQAGKSVDVVLEEGKKTKWVFKHADRVQAANVVIVGADEYANGEVAIKNMEVGEQVVIQLDDLEAWAQQQPQQ